MLSSRARERELLERDFFMFIKLDQTGKINLLVESIHKSTGFIFIFVVSGTN